MAPIALDNNLNVATTNKKAELREDTYDTGQLTRLAARERRFTTQTSGLAPSYVQANLIVLPSKYASDFRLLCQRNPVPCPLLAESQDIGGWNRLRSWLPGLTGEAVAQDLDLRNDFPKYMIYDDGSLTKSHVPSIESEWTGDHVGFLIGCSFSFESALAAAGLTLAHTLNRRNVPMYRTKIPLCPAGRFKNSTYIVSMRPFKRQDIERVRDITRSYVTTHGEPLDWGWDALERLGIKDIAVPEYGDAPVTADGADFVEGIGVGDEELVPVFWGCGVTPQEAIQRAGLEGRIFAHAPGHMIVLDIRDWDVVPKI